MNETIRLGRGRQITEIPRVMWEQHLSHAPDHSQTRLSFMSEAHHQVRYFVVKELVRSGAALDPEAIAQETQLPPARVNTILEELEKNLLFLVRDSQGFVSWAFPVTVDPTRHRLSFDTGERLYAA